MRILALALLLMPVPALAMQAKAPSVATLKAQERALRKQIVAITPEEVDMDLDATRFGLWMELAENLAKQGKVDAAVDIAYDGAAEIPTRSADFRGTARAATQEAAQFEERVRGGPTERSIAALWGAGASRQYGVSPADGEGRIRAFSVYNLATIARFGAVGRHAEAYALASAVLVENTEFRFRAASASSQSGDLAGYRGARRSLHQVIRLAWDFSRTVKPEDARALAGAEALLDAGDAAGAEAAFRTLLAARPTFLVVTAVQSRARCGLARALAAQGGAKQQEAAAELRTLLLALSRQSSRDDPRMLAVAGAYRALLVAGANGDMRAVTRFDQAMASFRMSGRAPSF